MEVEYTPMNLHVYPASFAATCDSTVCDFTGLPEKGQGTFEDALPVFEEICNNYTAADQDRAMATGAYSASIHNMKFECIGFRVTKQDWDNSQSFLDYVVIQLIRKFSGHGRYLEYHHEDPPTGAGVNFWFKTSLIEMFNVPVEVDETVPMAMWDYTEGGYDCTTTFRYLRNDVAICDEHAADQANYPSVPVN